MSVCVCMRHVRVYGPVFNVVGQDAANVKGGCQSLMARGARAPKRIMMLPKLNGHGCCESQIDQDAVTHLDDAAKSKLCERCKLQIDKDAAKVKRTRMLKVLPKSRPKSAHDCTCTDKQKPTHATQHRNTKQKEKPIERTRMHARRQTKPTHATSHGMQTLNS